MAKKINTNFRLGLNRQELIEAAQLFGKSLKTAKKDSTKRLEEYLTNKLGGKGTKVPTFSDQQKRDVRDSANAFGLQDALHMVSYRIGKLTGNQDETNYLRLSVGRAFQAYYDGGVRSEHIDALIARMPMGDKNEIISGVSRHDSYYQQLFLDYAEELQAQEETR
jgi:hypothetical protein